jgi:hypothetical protein
MNFRPQSLRHALRWPVKAADSTRKSIDDQRIAGDVVVALTDSGTARLRGSPGDPRRTSFLHHEEVDGRVKPGHDDVVGAPYAVAAIDVRKPSISACRLVVESDNSLADDSNWLDAAPVWLAPWRRISTIRMSRG